MFYGEIICLIKFLKVFNRFIVCKINVIGGIEFVFEVEM